MEGIHARTAGSTNERSERSRGRTVVVDFDGTTTIENTLDLAVARFGDPEAHRRAEAELGRTITLHELLAQSYGSLRASREEVVDWLVARTRFRSGVSRLVELCRERGWRLVIVSSGPRELIEPLLEREQLSGVELVANELEESAGWKLRFLDETSCAVCGEACKRRTVAEITDADEVVYVGDGYSDGCAAELADQVFARRRLSHYLRERGLAFEPFEDFFEVAERLDGGYGTDRSPAAEQLSARAARRETEARIWRELAASAERRLEVAEALHTGPTWRAFVRVMGLRARVAPPSSRRDRAVRALLRMPPPADARRRSPSPEARPGLRAVLFVSGRAGATRQYRCDLQAERLAFAGASADVAGLEDCDLDDALERYRLVVLHRVPFDVRVGTFLGAARDRGLPVIFDTDDLIFDESVAAFAPESALQRDGLLRHAQTLALSDGVAVSTEPLRAFAGAFHERVAVVPNAVGEEMMRLADAALARTRSGSAGHATIAYLSGTPTHDRDFLETADAMLWALERYPQTSFLSVGPLGLDARFRRFGDRVRQLPAVPWDELPKLLAGVDVNIAPLERANPFSDCKSCIKFLEAGLLGVPTIASPRPDFLRAIEPGRNGLLADSATEWREALELLIESPDERRRIGRAASQDVRFRHTTRAQAASAATTFRSLVHRPQAPLRVNWVTHADGDSAGPRLTAELEAAGHVIRFGLGEPADVSVATDQAGAEALLEDDCSLFRCYLDLGARRPAVERRLPLRYVDVELPAEEDNAAWRDTAGTLASILNELCFLRLNHKPTARSRG